MTQKKKDPAAVKLGRKGSKARLKMLGKEGLSEANRKAVQARWERYRKEQERSNPSPH